MSDRVADISAFLLQLDGLKSINRRTYINGGERVENSAEHSWHLAMACWAFADLLEEDFEVLLLIKLALVHDLGEIESGDTFLYSESRQDAHIEERKCVQNIASHRGNPIKNLCELWEQQETGNSKETKLLKAIDRLLPFLHNMTSEGRAWQDNNIKRSQVAAMHRFIQEDYPEIHQWFSSQLQNAVDQGWLRDA